MLRIIFFSLFLCATAQAQNSTALELNDVSVLFPLPETTEWNLLPHASTETLMGSLLDRSYVQRIPNLVENTPNDNIYDSLYAVGFRIDPCFAEGSAPLKCKQQIRIVWQVLQKEGEVTSTHDVALHSFYELSENEFTQLVQKMRHLKSSAPTDDTVGYLTVNPLIKKLGLKSIYYKKMLETIFQFIGNKNLSRITYMRLQMQGKNWTFGGFEIVDGLMKQISIPRVGSIEQQFTNVASPRPHWFQGGIFPAPKEAENINILTRSSRQLGPQDEEAIIEAVRSAFKFENPKLHNPGTVDCVSCHVAQPAKIWALRQYPWLELDILSRDSIYTNIKYNLRNMSPMQPRTDIVRSFGYFMNAPFVSQRTINESAEVAEYIKQNF